MDLVRVIAGCTHRSGLLDQYERQLRAAGIPLCLEVDPSYRYPNGWRMIGDHLDRLESYLDKYGDCENLIFTDAWDVLFYGTAKEVAAKIPDSGVLYGAERNCFPEAYLASAFPDVGPHRFLNGGLLAAKPAALRNWIFEARSHAAYHPAYMDQQWLNHRLLDRSPLPGKLDSETSLFYCLFKEQGQLELRDGRLTNGDNDSHPNFLHFNGNSGQRVWPLIERAAEKGISLVIFDEFRDGQQSRQVRVAPKSERDVKMLELAGSIA